MKHRISSGVILETDDRILLVRCKREGRYDFWVAPGGGVQSDESLQAAATREAREETGLVVTVGHLLYIEELLDPQTRYCKFWFAGAVESGQLTIASPEAKAEHIIEAAWVSRTELSGRTVFPHALRDRYWQDRTSASGPIHLGLRHMEIW